MIVTEVVDLAVAHVAEIHIGRIKIEIMIDHHIVALVVVVIVVVVEEVVDPIEHNGPYQLTILVLVAGKKWTPLLLLLLLPPFLPTYVENILNHNNGYGGIPHSS